MVSVRRGKRRRGRSTIIYHRRDARGEQGAENMRALSLEPHRHVQNGLLHGEEMVLSGRDERSAVVEDENGGN